MVVEQEDGREGGISEVQVSVNPSVLTAQALAAPPVRKYTIAPELEESFIRQCIKKVVFPKKKVIFHDSEIAYGTDTAKNVIDYVLYHPTLGCYRRDKDKMKPEEILQMETQFWIRNESKVRLAHKVRLNNTVGAFKKKFKSKYPLPPEHGFQLTVRNLTGSSVFFP